MTSRNIISGNVIQQDGYQTYDSNKCGQPTKLCKADEWRVKSVSCGAGAPKNVCSLVDPKVCPEFGGTRAISAVFDGAPNVKCSYDVSQIKTDDDLEKWMDIFGADNQTFNEIVMPAYCSTSTDKKCQKNADGLTPGTCSQFFSNSKGGDACRQWGTIYPNLANDAKLKYCQTHKTSECSCINRAENTEYQTIKSLVPNANDACWYRPCTANSLNLIPKDLMNPICTDATCQTVINEGGNLLPLTTLKTITSCSVPEVPKSNSFPWWILIGIIILVIIVAIGIYFLFRYNQSTTTMTTRSRSRVSTNSYERPIGPQKNR